MIFKNGIKRIVISQFHRFKNGMKRIVISQFHRFKNEMKRIVISQFHSIIKVIKLTRLKIHFACPLKCDAVNKFPNY